MSAAPDAAAVLSLAAFAFVTSVTPGPNNVMLLASGVNFGFRRTLPHMLGIAAGVAVMVFSLGLGAWPLLRVLPGGAELLRWPAAAWMLWLAWRIARAGTAGPRSDGAGTAASRPFGFLAAAAFQWANPKAWAMVLSALAAHGGALGVAGVAAGFALVGLPAIALWAAGGAGLRRRLADPVLRRRFNLAMAALLAASLLPMLAGWP